MPVDRNAAEKLGHEYSQGLIPRKPRVASRQRQSQEIRTTFPEGGPLGGGNDGYSVYMDPKKGVWLLGPPLPASWQRTAHGPGRKLGI
jgi:hypothetical protein